MGFTAIRDDAVRQCAAIDTPDARALVRVLSNVAVVDILRRFYKDHPALKLFWRARITRIVAIARDGASPPADRDSDELVMLLLHVVAQVRVHVHAADLQVRAWARACDTLHEDADALAICSATFCRAIDEPAARAAVRLSLSGTLVECLRCKCPVLPFE